MNVFQKIRNLFHKRSIVFSDRREATIEEKINFLIKFNNPKSQNYNKSSFCEFWKLYVEDKFIFDCLPLGFPELYQYRPLIVQYDAYGDIIICSKENYYWYRRDEEGFNKRHEIANELLGILYEKQQEMK